MTEQQVSDKRPTVLDVIRDLAAERTPAGAAKLALRFVGDAVRAGDLGKDELKALLAELPDATTESPVQYLNVRKQAFIEKFGIQVLGALQVALILPAGTSHIDFLNEAQTLARELHKRDAVWAMQLQHWSGDSNFTDKASAAQKLAVDGNVANSTGLSRTGQEARGWANVDLKDLAIEHVAYFVATGKDLFAGNIVRGRGGALYFLSDGLYVDDCSADSGYPDVSACRSLPFPN